MTPFRIRVDQLLVQPDEPQLDLAGALERAFIEDERPIEVVPGPSDGLWVIRNGRHRFVGALLAGRDTVLAVEVPS